MRRFWAKVRKTRGCWNWVGALKGNGYGHAFDGERVEYVHRISYRLHHGQSSIPVGMNICHRCDNRRCVRPDHLFLGTRKDNQNDMAKKGRHGLAKLNASQVRYIRRARGRGETCEAIGRRLGVSKILISRAARGETYGWVT